VRPALERAYLLAIWLWERVAGSRASTDKQIISVFAGGRPERRGQRLALFASYDSQARVDDYVFRYLEALRDELDADIVFVTTSSAIAAQDLARLRPLCRAIVHRRNLGLDFGSWKVAIDQVRDWREYEAVILANDSVYGPLRPLDGVARLLGEAGDKARVVGITESLQYGRHLQSYFLAFNRVAANLPFFARFWRDFHFYSHKLNIIHRQEIALSGLARAGGAELVALCPYDALCAAARREGRTNARWRPARPLNPTHDLWRTALLDFASPFIKGELVKTNPLAVPDLAELPRVLREVGGDAGAYPWELIARHRQRLGLPPFAGPEGKAGL
jgi:lipopolysaccharide biosynthesis protein